MKSTVLITTQIVLRTSIRSRRTGSRGANAPLFVLMLFWLLIPLVLLGGVTCGHAQAPEQQPFDSALQDQSIPELQRLLSEKADVNKPEQGWYPLESAAGQRWCGGVEFLLDHGADPYIQSQISNEPLWFSADDSLECLRIYHKHGVDFNKPDKDGKTVLMDVAFYHPNLAVIRFLLQSGADVKQKDNSGKSILYYARTLSIVNLLLLKGADVNAKGPNGLTPLMQFSQNDRNNGVVGENLHSIVKTLIEHGANIDMCNDEGDTALIFAAGSHDLQSIQLLLHYHARLDIKDKKDRDGLQAAIENQDAEIERMLVKAGSVRTPQHILWKATYAKDQKQLTAALSLGAKPNVLNGQGMSPLMVAISQDDVASLKTLLAHGANANFLGNDGLSALMVAAYSPHYGITPPLAPALLLAAGANINAKEQTYGLTPLVIAAQASNSYVVSFLLKHGADVNSIDKSSETFLETLQNDKSNPPSQEIIDLLKAAGAK